MNRNGQKVRPLARWKGQLVESVGWNKALGTESSTGPILVGTAQGQCVLSLGFHFSIMFLLYHLVSAPLAR